MNYCNLEAIYRSVKPQSIDSQMIKNDPSFLAYAKTESLLAQMKWCRIYNCTNTRNYRILREYLVSVYSEWRIKRLEEIL